MLDLSFQPAAPSDMETLLVMVREFYAHEELAFVESAAQRALNGILNNPAFGRVFLICVGDEVAGYTVLTLGYSLEFHGRDAFVDELFLLEKFRGQGISQHTLEFLAAVCRENSVAALHLEVERKNLAAQAAYRKFGFADHDRYLMTKWLDAE